MSEKDSTAAESRLTGKIESSELSPHEVQQLLRHFRWTPGLRSLYGQPREHIRLRAENAVVKSALGDIHLPKDGVIELEGPVVLGVDAETTREYVTRYTDRLEQLLMTVEKDLSTHEYADLPVGDLKKLAAKVALQVSRTDTPSLNEKGSRPLSQAQERASFLIDTLGGASILAELLDVSRSQPGRWKTGAETPSPPVSALLIDLDYVMARATLMWEPEIARQWLLGNEPFLEGARPIDVLRLRGSGEVVDALDAVMAGAYA